MDMEYLVLSGVGASSLLLAFVVFGVTVVRRRDPPVHMLFLGAYALGNLIIALMAAARGRGPGKVEVWIAASLAIAAFVLVLSVVGWALAVAVRPGEPVATTWRGLQHIGIVAAGIVITGLSQRQESLSLWWFPNLVHVVLAFRDSPRLRVAWGTIASVGLAVTVGWTVVFFTYGRPPDEVVFLAPLLCLHHLIAIAQARHAAPAVALWPLLAHALFAIVHDRF